MKRTLFLLTVVMTVIFLALSACGGGGGLTENEISATQTAQAVWNQWQKVASQPTPTLDWGNCTAAEAAKISYQGKDVFSECNIPTPSP